MNSDRISKIAIATGPRGSNKSLLMTGNACYRLAKVYMLNTYKGEKQKVLSNIPFGYNFYDFVANKKVHLQSEPFNMEMLYILDSSLFKVWIYIDEIDQWWDRQEWNDGGQKMGNKSTRMLRKRQINIFGTTQSLDWINPRLQFQTDIVIKCRDLVYTPWGKSNHLEPGEVALTQWLDKSGIMTGYPYAEFPRVYTKKFFGKRFWDCYLTEFEFNPTETSTRYKQKRLMKEIDLTGGAAALELNNPNNLNNNDKSAALSRLKSLSFEAVNQLRSEGLKTTSFPQIMDIVQGLAGPNTNVSKYHLGRALSEIGIRTSGRHNEKYNLDFGDFGTQVSELPEDVRGNFPDINQIKSNVVRDAEELIRNSNDVAVPV